MAITSSWSFDGNTSATLSLGIPLQVSFILTIATQIVVSPARDELVRTQAESLANIAEIGRWEEMIKVRNIELYSTPIKPYEHHYEMSYRTPGSNKLVELLVKSKQTKILEASCSDGLTNVVMKAREDYTITWTEFIQLQRLLRSMWVLVDSIR